ncbi:glycoside hydrolase family 10 protein [Actinoalloteichus hymeniacidonis]|uniref:Glycosyl hydrolase-like 10 domain-containing protein n=1 Tax=Actinoalloteichus hymeniacidonis TaxID=340345 RepID=A0AAC9MXR2_9PSEU|nr:family 10 glycosylhydrolase [Actinoalloteichus hymeniacidonis]AOS63568.1 hypothetical protein TL08_13770 [Actinoalloteichus hymeniacidonis]MBB5908386.1 uncharacterized lipoprotein YddW (UPF0748 family) [Actinoalloteichus hymeniacidonis]
MPLSRNRIGGRSAVALAAAVGLLCSTLSLTSAAAGTPRVENDTGAEDAAPRQSTQLRGTWVSSVSNIDWPSRSGLSAETQQQEYVALLDEAVDLRLNAVFVQIRPTADAFWPSPHEPWSQWLTGTQGADPGYDPLAFLVEEAHARGLEFHAWFNPYRVSTQSDPSKLAPDHPARVNPDWIFRYGSQLYYNPGIPEVRKFVQTAMMDAVENYDIDGAHWDDYFYPYPISGESIPDQDTYAEFGDDFDSIEDWRRNNIDLLVQEMGERIEAVKPDVAFGVSPFGIWRNDSSDPAGSDTNGLESYSAIFADTRRWVTQGWVDYISPQVYWEIGHAAADYAVLVPWWADVVAGTDVRLYIGQAAYKVGSNAAWDTAELSEHLTLNEAHPEVGGDVFFSHSSLTSNAAEAMARVVADHYTEPAGG